MGCLDATIDHESGDDSGSNFHFDLDQSPDAQSFPRCIDRDDTGSDTDDSDEHAETIEIDASGRPAHPTEGPALASYAHVETRFAPQVPQEIDILLNSTINSANAFVNTAQAARVIFEARFSQTPNVSSLTGMPPSAQEVEAARWKVKDAVRKILETL